MGWWKNAKAEVARGKIGESLHLRSKVDPWPVGEPVRAVVVVDQPFECQSVDITFVYVDTNLVGVNAVPKVDPIRLASGPVEAGRLEFEVQLPDDALPSYDCDRGRLYWAGKVDVNLGEGGQLDELFRIEVASKASVKRAVPSPNSVTEGDLEVSPLRGGGRPGDRIAADITVGEPNQSRKIEAGLVGTRTRTTLSHDGDRGELPTAERMLLHEEWTALPAANGPQHVEFTIPTDAVFSYPGTLLAVRWEIVLREERALKRDIVAASEIAVLPA